MHLTEGAGAAGNDAARREPSGRSALVAAYREGLGLAAVMVIRCPGGIRVAAAAPADEAAVAAAEPAAPRWWCRRLNDAERIAAAATARLRRRDPRDAAARAAEQASSRAQGAAAALALACESIASAAEQLNIALQTETETFAEAMTVIARVDEEIERLQRAGELKSINKSYRIYRLEASARGERIARYGDWMGKYRQKLVRELAAALRYS